jgi:hypothetical protein
MLSGSFANAYYGAPRLDRPYLEKWVAELGLDKEWNDARRTAGIA